MKTMADEIDLETLDTEIEKDNKVEKRIKDLSEKVRLTSDERDEQKRLLGESDKKIADLERENAFSTGFADVLADHSAAKDHRDEIKAKVLTGYSVEDAMFAVLGKAGKLGQPRAEVINPAGGSATTQPVVSSDKPISQLTRDEKRTKLLEAEASGEISMT